MAPACSYVLPSQFGFKCDRSFPRTCVNGPQTIWIAVHSGKPERQLMGTRNFWRREAIVRVAWMFQGALRIADFTQGRSNTTKRWSFPIPRVVPATSLDTTSKNNQLVCATQRIQQSSRRAILRSSGEAEHAMVFGAIKYGMCYSGGNRD